MAPRVFGTGSPHAAALSASRVGSPFGFCAGPLGLLNMRVRKLPLRRIFVGVFAGPLTPGRSFAPVSRAYFFRPSAVRPPFGSLSVMLRARCAR